MNDQFIADGLVEPSFDARCSPETDSATLTLEGSDMAKTRQPQNTSTRLAARFNLLARTAVRTFNALSADRALAQRAATTAALPRQRLTELRALYTTHDTVLACIRVPTP